MIALFHQPSPPATHSLPADNRACSRSRLCLPRLAWGTFLAACLLLVSACSRTDAIVVIALHPTKPRILYVATNDYIYKSRDEGRTWENISRGMSHSRVISMAIDPTYPAIIYAGTKGDAVYKSFDGGQRWVPKRNGLDDVTITSVVNQFVFDPAESRRIFVATTMGVFETRDSGDAWQKRMKGMKEVLMVVCLAVDPKTPTTMYAGTSGGIYKSDDRAMNWRKVNQGLVPQDMVQSSRALNVIGIKVDPHDSQTVYAATLSGMYKTLNAAGSWTRIAETLPDQMISEMLLDAAHPGVIYVASRQGVHKSEDGGMSWTAKNEGFDSLNMRSLVQSPRDPLTLYAGTNGSGLYRTRDGGDHWEHMPEVAEKKEVKGGK